MSRKVNMKMRVYHRYLGFFLVGIMAVYAVSGIILIFRDTDAFKVTKEYEETFDEPVALDELGQKLRMRDLKIDKVEEGRAYFKNGVFDMKSNKVNYSKEELPAALETITHLHKAKTRDTLFFLNIFFGLGLLFFVISSFWMFFPGTDLFRKGMYFVLAGAILTLVMLFV